MDKVIFLTHKTRVTNINKQKINSKSIDIKYKTFLLVKVYVIRAEIT